MEFPTTTHPSSGTHYIYLTAKTGFRSNMKSTLDIACGVSVEKMESFQK